MDNKELKESILKEFDKRTFNWQYPSGMVKWSEVRIFLQKSLDKVISEKDKVIDEKKEHEGEEWDKHIYNLLVRYYAKEISESDICDYIKSLLLEKDKEIEELKEELSITKNDRTLDIEAERKKAVNEYTIKLRKITHPECPLCRKPWNDYCKTCTVFPEGCDECEH